VLLDKTILANGGWLVQIGPILRGMLSKQLEVGPTREELAEDIKTISWVAIGKKYGVSDNAARKWARKFNLFNVP